MFFLFFIHLKLSSFIKNGIAPAELLNDLSINHKLFCRFQWHFISFETCLEPYIYLAASDLLLGQRPHRST